MKAVLSRALSGWSMGVKNLLQSHFLHKICSRFPFGKGLAARLEV